MSPASDPHPRGAQRFIGRPVSFDYAASRLVGIVEQARFIGFTQRGAIPDSELTVRGSSGKTVVVSLVESHATFPE